MEIMETKMEWTFKKEAPMQGSSNGFWYDITEGGYVKAAEVLADPEQIELIRDALHTLNDFKSALEASGFLDEF